jgi:hypothetical protein
MSTTVTQSLTLAAATAQPVVIDLSSLQEGVVAFYLTLHNTGANPIGTILWERSALGDDGLRVCLGGGDFPGGGE